ncbi:hypothetical protein [Hypericibacter sp.]|uniref:hypothetical protein n=1 Tax=Hypericibacter sp. TaxID=2705401 RepID=UPI003D6D41C1
MGAEEQVRRVVHGLAHWSSLREYGFELDLQEERGRWRSWTFGRCPCRITVQPDDVMKGILKLQSNPDALSEWAFFLMGSDSVDYAGEDDSARNEALREIVAGLAADEPLEAFEKELAVLLRADE